MKPWSVSGVAACCMLGLLFTGTASAAELYSNGPVVGANGKSVLASPAVTLGFGAQHSSQNAVADDFTVTGGSAWSISSIDFFAYQNNATSFTLQNVSWSILSGDVNNGSVIASGSTALGNGGLVGYRVTAAAQGVTTKQIYRATADITDLSLSAGHYWLRWSLTGSLSSGPWQPPTSDGALGNAMQSGAGGPFVSLIDGGSKKGVELPFVLNGVVSAVPEPASAGLMLVGGLALLGLARRRTPEKSVSKT